ncbi:MAG: glycogen/starch/alpha-glucan phosphorylase [Bifidobacteriaceae bacterium]|jgi:starch phosphorylase|nr:glycogen/starch/alpha-glucan phosphorylase [Bifidobacteriaceae bacterium]MCI1915424.1 glycogen/starch/alpha-glucan phosphorylase [Bifidobacteriaceae bacterium]
MRRKRIRSTWHHRKSKIVSEHNNTQQFKDEIIAALRYSRGVTPEEADVNDVYVAASTAVRNRLVDTWVKTRTDTLQGSTKAVGYLSAEFLLGTQLPNAVLNAGLTEEFDQAVTELGFDPRAIEDAEYEPGLGNGGLGRLAACFIDSLATLAVPAIGYGIRYEYGIFRQEFGEDGAQIERPDYWLRDGNPWEQADYRREQTVHFGGSVVSHGGKKVWKPAWGVRAVPYDYMVPGFRSGRVNTLRLWSAKALDEFDLQTFNKSEYDEAVKAQTAAENISKVLYPEDSTLVGKQLRLEQQYFFTAASLADTISLFYPGQEHPDLTTLPEKITFQLNDTHPVIAIPELMRLMMDVYGYDWDTAWATVQKVFNYTCHTLLPEALEVWPASLLGSLLPRHLEIIERISDGAVAEQEARGADAATVDRMRILTADGPEAGAHQQVRMAYLATVGGSHVNGVAELHSELLKASVLKDFADVYPERFTNVTNGVTPRRFVRLANPRLSDLITEGLGTDAWLKDLSKLEGLENLASDGAFVDRYAAVKRANKADFATWYRGVYGVNVDPNSMFNTMIKRLHEYKRQSMKILQVIALYADIKSGKIDVNAADFVPRTVIFGAKSAPGYALAKETIKLINNVARVIDADPAVQGKLRVIFPYNYNVTVAQHIIPATDLDEQISLAGKEASGTSNMKFALNGALTVGTLDGANVEIRNRVGAENFFLFGMDVDGVSALETAGYNPRRYYEEDKQLKAAIDMIASGVFSEGDKSVFAGFVSDLLDNDRFMALADFRAYMDIQSSIETQYRDEHEWARKALLNTARSGYFSSDRSIRDYLDRVWMTEGLPAA